MLSRHAIFTALLLVVFCTSTHAHDAVFDVEGKLVVDGGLRDLIPRGLQLFASELARFAAPERFDADAPVWLEWPHLLQVVGARAHMDQLEQDGVLRTTKLTELYPPYAFIPRLAARVVPSGGSNGSSAEAWRTACWGQTSVEVESFSPSGAEFLMVAQDRNETSKCADMYIAATRKGGWFKMVTSNTTAIDATFTGASDPRYMDIKRNGLRVYHLPLGLIGTAISLWNTVKLFIAENFQEVNIEFLEQVSPEVWDYKARTAGFVDLSADEIPDGTHLIISRLDGFESMTQWGVGSWSGHHAHAVRMDTSAVPGASGSGRQLFVIEATDVPPGTDPYWPGPYGVIATPWDQWVAQARNASYMVNVAPLSDANQKLYDAAGAEGWFKKTQGLPYGFANFVFEWIDTGIGNLPWKPESPEIAALIFDMLDNRLANGTKTSCYNLFLKAMGHRTKQQLDSMEDLWVYLDSAYPKTVDLFTVFERIIDEPEQDEWDYAYPDSFCNKYRQGPCTGPARICDTEVFALYKAAGIIPENLDIMATEFTPRDSFWVDIYNTSWVKPAACSNDPESFKGYCQIMGKYQFELPKFSSLPLYSKMNENCDTLPPLYERKPGC